MRPIVLVLSLFMLAICVPVHADYESECVEESCNTEELQEIYTTYNHECMFETCSAEEVYEDAGTAAETNPMLMAFLAQGWEVLASTFNGPATPPAGAIWNYSVCGYGGTVAQVSSADNSLMLTPAAIMLGSGVWAESYPQMNYQGNGFTFARNVSCIATSFPDYTNIQSMRPLSSSPPSNLKYNQVSWVMAHNAYANYADGWRLLVNQTQNVAQQLNGGVRGLMLDIDWWTPSGGSPGVYLCHGDCNLTYYQTGFSPRLLSATLMEVLDFLNANPSAIVTIDFEIVTQVTAQQLADVFSSTCNDTTCADQLIFRPDGQQMSGGLTWNVNTSGWPTLKWMQANNKRLVVFAESRNVGFPLFWTYSVETEFSYSPFTRPYWTTCTNRSQSPPLDRNPPALFTMNQFFTPPDVSCSLGAGNYTTLMDRINGVCHTNAGRYPNFIAVDFYECGTNGGPIAAAKQVSVQMTAP